MEIKVSSCLAWGFFGNEKNKNIILQSTFPYICKYPLISGGQKNKLFFPWHNAILLYLSTNSFIHSLWMWDLKYLYILNENKTQLSRSPMNNYHNIY